MPLACDTDLGVFRRVRREMLAELEGVALSQVPVECISPEGAGVGLRLVLTHGSGNAVDCAAPGEPDVLDLAEWACNSILDFGDWACISFLSSATASTGGFMMICLTTREVGEG